MNTAFKYTIIILWILIGHSHSIFGQMSGDSQGQGVIKGNLTDSLTGKPLEYVAVALRRGNFTKIINGSITDEKGSFRLEGIGVGVYKLTFTFIGYEPKTVNKVEITATNSEFSGKNILLKPTVSTLKEVEITAQKQLIEQHVDKIVYNVEKDAGASTQTLNDILRKVPMVSVDAEGTPSLRGNTNVQVLINGKPSGIFAASIADALRTIPADQVSRIEVLTSVSAKYDAEGTAGIINIITKKKQIEGYNGSANLSAGRLLGNGSLNLNMRTGKVGVNASLSGNAFFPRVLTNNMFRQDNFGETKRIIEQLGTVTMNRYSESAKLGFDYDINSQNSITTTFQLTNMRLNGIGSTNVMNTVQVKDTQTINRSLRDLSNLKTDKNFDWTTDYKRTFKNPKNELSSSVRWSHFKSDGTYFIDETQLITKEQGIREKGLNNGSTDEVTGQIDYTCAIGKTATLETGAKNIYRNIGSLSDYMEYSEAQTDYKKNNQRSNDFNYLQNVSAIYAQSNFTTKKNWNIQLGSRLENTYIKSVDFNGQPIQNNYLNLTPSVLAAYTFKNSANLRFSYNRRIQRPGLAQLNPFINSVDPQNLMQGNIFLKPEIADKLEANYSYYFKKGFVYLSTFYSRTSGLIERLLTVSPSGISMSTFQNVGISHSYGSQVYASYQPTTVWTVRGGVNAFTYNTTSAAALGSLSNKGVQYETYLTSSLSFKNGFGMDAVAQYKAPTYTIQGRTQDMFVAILSAKMDVLKKKGSISLTAINPFVKNLTYGTILRGETFEQTKSMILPFRTVNVGFTYKFGKAMKMGKEKKSVQNNDLKQGEKENL